MQVGLIVGGKYRLEREIGEGAMGTVWAGVHELLGKRVAIKFSLAEGMSHEPGETAAARFLAEAKAAARVKHRYVVDVFDFGISEDGTHYMVQELLEGEPLGDVMYQGPAWSVESVLRFLAECLLGLEAVHQNGIVHRDLKPDNIFVIHDGEGSSPKLLDFGISKAAETGRPSLRPSQRAGRARRLTGVGTTIGTPAYMSPEQLCNASNIDGRADLYSVGVILYEWLSGQVPFGELASPAELYKRISERGAPELRSLRPELGEPLCALVMRALEPEPARRFASASAMRSELLRLAAQKPSGQSVVQREGVQKVQSGAATDGLLAAANTPFRDDDAPISIAGLTRPRVRGWVVASSLCLLAVGIAASLYLPAGLDPAALASPSSSRPAARVEDPSSPRAALPLAREAPSADARLPADPGPGARQGELADGREHADGSVLEALDTLPLGVDPEPLHPPEPEARPEPDSALTADPAPRAPSRARARSRRARQAGGRDLADAPSAAAATSTLPADPRAAGDVVDDSKNTKVIRQLDF